MCQNQMLGHTNYSVARVLVAVVGADHRVGRARYGGCPVLGDSKGNSSRRTMYFWMSSLLLSVVCRLAYLLLDAAGSKCQRGQCAK